MSKVKKVVVKHISEGKLQSHFPSQSISTMPQVALNQDRSETINESPYSKKLIKHRSVSTLKDPSLSQPSGMVSPPLKSKFPSTLKTKFNLSTSFMSKVKESNEIRSRSTKKLVLYNKKFPESDCDSLEFHIEELSKRHRENGISSELFEKFEECFNELISKFPGLAGLLSKIKLAYNDWIKFKSFAEISQLQSEILEFRRKYSEEIEENKLLHRKIQKFSRENVELGRSLDEKDSNFRTLQEYLLKVTNINIDSLPQDKISWKVLVAENKSYADLCEKLKKKLKVMKKKENKLMKLFWIMKQKGYPVEELHEKLGKKAREPSVNVSITELSDNEPINAEPAKFCPKPGNIPFLKMEQVEPNSFTERESGSEDLLLE